LLQHRTSSVKLASANPEARSHNPFFAARGVEARFASDLRYLLASAPTPTPTDTHIHTHSHIKDIYHNIYIYIYIYIGVRWVDGWFKADGWV